eukprot:SAG11_NODE_192_length_12931_cov_5.747682_17_plen_195_part_00
MTAPQVYQQRAQGLARPTFTPLPLARQTQHQRGNPHTNKVGKVLLSYKAGESFLPLALYHTIIDAHFNNESYSAAEYKKAGWFLEEEPTGAKGCFKTSTEPAGAACTTAWADYQVTKKAIKSVDKTHAIFNLECAWTDADNSGNDPSEWWLKWNSDATIPSLVAILVIPSTTRHPLAPSGPSADVDTQSESINY